MKERDPRPAPEQPDRIEKLDRQIQAADSFIHKREILLCKYGLSDLAEQAQTAHDLLLQTIRTELKAEASEFVVFEAPKPPKKETNPRKRKEKSRGLKDPRPVEFVLPNGKQLRGKEGKIIKFLSRAKNRTLNRERLSAEVYPGIKPKKAGELLNRSARSARKHAIRNGQDIVAKRDYERKTTNYSLVDRPKRKKKR